MNTFKLRYFFIAFVLFSQCTMVNSKLTNQTNTQIIPVWPQSISFAGEVAPLDKHYVLERLDRELLVNNFWHSNSILVLKRAAKYFPIIEPILQENGIPDDFKYLAVIESGLTQVTSPVGAEGFWQFMPQTARDFGLEVNGDIDERLNLIKATESAAAYLTVAYAEFGNWTLAAAAYNAGVQRIKTSLGKQQTNSYYDLFLNEETSRYMYRMLATKLIFESPESYGFVIPKAQTYQFPKNKLVKVSISPIDWVAFAQSQNMSYADLREMNPWIKGYQLSNRNNKVYEVRVLVD
jgi:hypothetical protein